MLNMTMLRLITTTLSLLSIALAQQTFWKESFQLNFDYIPDSDIGPDNWGNIDVGNSEWEQYVIDNPDSTLSFANNRCDVDFRPSPIPLTVSGSCEDIEMYMRQVNSKTDCVAKDASFEVLPHTIRAYFPSDDTTCERPTLQLAGTDSSPFVLQWMEIHARSEHVVNGLRFDAELQMVHFGTEGNSDRMLVVSVLIDANARADHAEFQLMLDQWQAAADLLLSNCSEGNAGRRRQALRSTVMTQRLSRRKEHSFRNSKAIPPSRRHTQECTGSNCGPRKRMFPYSMWPSIWFYDYNGSLTTPPCSPVVTWRIIDMPMTISRRQYKQLATLLAAYKSSDCSEGAVLSPTGENFRPLTNSNDNIQDVTHCTVDDFEPTLYDAGSQ